MNKIIFIIVILLNTHLLSQWTECNTGIPFTLFSVSAVNNNVVWAAASGTYVMRTTDGGISWVNAGAGVPPPAGVFTNVWAFDENTSLVCNYAGSPVRTAYAYKTTNGGANWEKVFQQGSNAFLSGFWFKNASTGIMIGWPVGGRWSIWRSTDAGTTWDSSGLYLPETNSSAWSFENGLYYLGSHIWFGARDKGIYHSTNDGISWTLESLPGGGYIMPSAVWFDDPLHGFSSGAFNIVYTSNGGTNWNVSPGTSGSYAIRGITGQGNEWWYIREVTNTIHYSSNFGQSFSVQYTAPTSTYRHITKARTGSTLWATRVDGGISKYTGVTGITELTSTPDEFRLYQNYPNPFNPSTIINFKVAASTTLCNRNIELKVYNVMGREMEILVNEKLQPGEHQVQFNGSNYPSGVYFYTLSAGYFRETRKMILVK